MVNDMITTIFFKKIKDIAVIMLNYVTFFCHIS